MKHRNKEKFFNTSVAILFCVIFFPIVPIVHAQQSSGSLSFKEELIGTDGNTDETIDNFFYEYIPLKNLGKVQYAHILTSDSSKSHFGIAFPNIIGSSIDTDEKAIQIPHRVTITSATLYLRAYSIPYGGTDYAMKLKTYRATRPWLEGGDDGTHLTDASSENGSTWEKSEDYYTAEGEEREWGSPGALGTGDIDPASKVEMDVTSEAYYQKFIPINVIDIVQQWANGMPNYGWIIEATRAGTRDNAIGIISADYTQDSSLRPYLEVTYEMQSSSDTTGPTINAFSAQTGATYKTATFSWTVASGSVDDVAGYEIRYATSTIITEQDFSNATPLQHSIASADRTSTLTLPDLGGTEYYLAFKAYDAVGNYSTMLTSGKVATNNNPATLDKIEITFQPGDTKGNISNVNDATISSYGPRINYGAETTLESLYQYDTYYGRYEEKAILLQFPEFIGNQNPVQTANRGKEQVLPGSRVEKADVWFTSNGTLYPRKYFSVHKISKPWIEGNQTADPIDYPTETGVTWNRSQDFYTAEGAETSWSAPGMKSGDDFRSQGETLCAPGDTICSETLYSYTTVWMKNLVVTDSVRDWVDDSAATASSQNYGITIRGTNDNGRKWPVYSSEYSTRERRPMLRVVIDLPEPPTDTTAPQMQSVAATTSASVFNEIDVQWTPEAVSENDISQFIIKYSENEVVSETDFLNATTYAVIQDPSTREVSLRLPPPAGTTYFIATRAIDAAGNSSNFVTTSATTNNDLYNLPSIEVTFQEGGDSKNSAITKTEDATIMKDTPRWNFGQNTELWLTSDGNRKTLIQFPSFIGTNNPLTKNAEGDRVFKNAEQVPRNVEIVNANISMLPVGSTNRIQVQIGAYPLRKPWREGTEGRNQTGYSPPYFAAGDYLDSSTENGVTWEKSEDYYTAEGQETRWETAGANKASDDMNIVADQWESNVNIDSERNPIIIPYINDNFFDVTITNAVQDWVDDPNSSKDISANFGLILQTNINLEDIASSEYSTTSYHPMLSVEYKTPARPTETTPPTISNFQVKSSETVVNHVDLSWETTDADIVGYDIRYSTQAIDTDDKFSFADVIPYHFAKDGKNFSTTLPGLPGTQYYFAIKAQDNSDNVSTLSQVGPIATNADLYDLPTVEVTFQEGGDSKNSAITKTEDATIMKVIPRWNVGQNTELWLTSDGNKKTLIQFPSFIGTNNPLAINTSGERVFKDAEQVPRNVEIVNANISMLSIGSTNQTQVQIDVYPLRKPWREGTEGRNQTGYSPPYFAVGDYLDCSTENGVTWEKSEDYYTAEGQETRWETAGANKASDDMNIVADQWESNVNIDSERNPIIIPYIKYNVNFFDVTITNAVRDWVKDISTNFGLILQTNKNLHSIASSEYTEYIHRRPILSVEYTTPSRPTDTTTPQLSSFSAITGTTYGEVDFAWTATDDVNVSGIEIRYSTNPIMTDAEYMNAQTWPEIFDASLDHATIRFLERGGTGYYFAARASDAAENYSAFIKTDTILSNADRTTLEWIEITAQEGGDCRNIAITKTEDTLISSSHQSFAAGTETQATIGPYGNAERALLIAFPNIIGSNDPLNGKSDGSATYYGTEQIPPLSNIRNATLTLVPYDTGSNNTVSAYQMRRPWTEGKFTDATKTQDTLYCPGDFGTTWEKALDYYTLEGDERYWFSAGAKDASNDPQKDADRTSLDMNSGTTYTTDYYYLWDIKILDAVNDWVNNKTFGGNNGLRIDATKEIENFRTSENSTTWQRPMLSVEFDVTRPSGATLDTPTDFTVESGSAFNTIRLSWQEPSNVSEYHIHVSDTAPTADKDAWWQIADVVSFDPAAIKHENGIATVEIFMREPVGVKNYYFGLRAFGTGNAWSEVVTAGPVTSNIDKTQAKIVEVQMQDNRSCSGSRDITLTETQDTLISQTSPDNNYGQNTELQYGDKDRIRMLLRWPNLFGDNNPQTDSVQKGKEQVPFASAIDPSIGDLGIYQAKLKFVYKSNSNIISSANPFGGYEITKEWQEGTQANGPITNGGEEGVTWKNQRDFAGTTEDVAWETSGADYEPTNRLEAEFSNDNYTNDWSIKGIVEQWAYDNSAEKSLLFQYSSTSSNTYKYYSSEDVTERYRPLLRVSYYIDHPPYTSFDINMPEGPETPKETCRFNSILDRIDVVNSCDGYDHISNTFTVTDYSTEPDADEPISDFIQQWQWFLDTDGNKDTYEIEFMCTKADSNATPSCVFPSVPNGAIQALSLADSGAPNFKIQYNKPGTYFIKLRTFDSDYANDSDDTFLEVVHKIIAYNKPPKASFEIDLPENDPEATLSGELGRDPTSEEIMEYCSTHTEGGTDVCDGYSHGYTVTFQNYSQDPDGDELTCTWDFGDGQTATNCDDQTHTFPSLVPQDELSYTYTTTLKVTDGYADQERMSMLDESKNKSGKSVYMAAISTVSCDVSLSDKTVNEGDDATFKLSLVDNPIMGPGGPEGPTGPLGEKLDCSEWEGSGFDWYYGETLFVGDVMGIDTATLSDVQSYLNNTKIKVFEHDDPAFWVAEATLYVTDIPAPTISTHPQSITVNEGDSATFNVSARVGEGSRGILTYQWQKKDRDEPDFSNIDGETSSSYTKVTTTSDHGYLFRVIVTDNFTEKYATSNSAELSVEPPTSTIPLIVTLNKGDYFIEDYDNSYGGGFTLQATVAGGIGTYSYEWKEYEHDKLGSCEDFGTQVSTSNFLSVLNADEDNHRSTYCVKVTSGSDTASAETKLYVMPDITSFSATPRNGCIPAGTQVIFSTDAVPGTDDLEIYFYENGSKLNSSSSATYTKTMTTADNGQEFYSKITNASGEWDKSPSIYLEIGKDDNGNGTCDVDESVPLSVTLNEGDRFVENYGDQTTGGGFTLIATASGGTGTYFYKWEEKYHGTADWVDLSQSSSILSFLRTDEDNHRSDYRVTVTSGSETASAETKLFVSPDIVSFLATPSSGCIAEGTDVTFSVSAQPIPYYGSNDLLYTFLWNDGVVRSQDDASTYIRTMLSEDTGEGFSVKVDNDSGVSAYSSSIMLDIGIDDEDIESTSTGNCSDDLDNDCDGATDEDDDDCCIYYGGEGALYTGSCSDKRDNDCDEYIDADDTGCQTCTEGETQVCGINTGQCEKGEETCTASGTWGTCEGATWSSEESTDIPGTCGDEIDNDCDGATDGNDIVDPGCYCDRDGDDYISGDSLHGDYCGGDDCDDSSDTVYPGATEFCNYADDDCDGENDEGYDRDDFCELTYTLNGYECNITGIKVCDTPTSTACAAIYPDEAFADDDKDGIYYGCDNCGDTYNPNQIDTDGNGYGDACDAEACIPTGSEICYDGIDNDCDEYIDSEDDVCIDTTVLSHIVTIYNSRPTASFEIDSSGDVSEDHPGKSDCSTHSNGDNCDDTGNHNEIFTFDGTLSWDDDQDELIEWAWNFYNENEDEIFSCGSHGMPLCDTTSGLPTEIVSLSNSNGDFKTLEATFAPGTYYIKLNVKDSYNFWDKADDGITHKIEVVNTTPINLSSSITCVAKDASSCDIKNSAFLQNESIFIEGKNTYENDDQTLSLLWWIEEKDSGTLIKLPGSEYCGSGEESRCQTKGDDKVSFLLPGFYKEWQAGKKYILHLCALVEGEKNRTDPSCQNSTDTHEFTLLPPFSKIREIAD